MIVSALSTASGRLQPFFLGCPSAGLSHTGQAQCRCVAKALQDHPATLTAANLRGRLAGVGGVGGSGWWRGWWVVGGWWVATTHHPTTTHHPPRPTMGPSQKEDPQHDTPPQAQPISYLSTSTHIAGAPRSVGDLPPLGVGIQVDGQPL